MSTKIFNGIMLNGVYTIEDMTQFINSIRAPIKEAVYLARAEEILSTACLIYDMHYVMKEDYFNPDEDERIPLLASSRRHVIRSKEESSEYNVAIGHIDGYTLGMFFFDDRKSEEVILNHPMVQYFGYWDNSDPDENVSEQEWNLRESLWNKMFEQSPIPSEAMFVSRILSNRYIMPEDHHMEAAIPSLETRRNSIIQNLSFMLAKQEFAEENELDEHELDYSRNLYEIIERSEKSKIRATQLVPITSFKENITLKDLSENIPNIKNKKENVDGSGITGSDTDSYEENTDSYTTDSEGSGDTGSDTDGHNDTD